FLAVSQHLHLRILADHRACDEVPQLTHVEHFFPIECNHDIPALDARCMGRAVFIHIADEHAFAMLRKLEGFCQGRCNLLNRDTHPAAHDLTGFLQTLNDVQCDTARNSESYPLGSSSP